MTKALSIQQHTQPRSVAILREDHRAALRIPGNMEKEFIGNCF